MRRKRVTADGLGAAVLTGAALVVGFGLTGVGDETGLGAWLTSMGRLTGLLAGYAVVVLVVLMCRLPLLERHLGADRLTRWHASGGRWTTLLLIAHVVLIAWGYAVTSHRSVLGQTATLVLDYPDVLMATVGFALLLAVAAMSVRAARRRMAYETWSLLHIYTYLAVALSFAHQFATGADFVDDRRARVLWSALYAAAAVAVAYRFLAPVVTGLRHRARVHAVHVEAPGVVSLEVSGVGFDRMRAQAGQFFRVRVLDRQGWWQAHPYSLSASVAPGRMRFTVKDLGDESGRVGRLEPGTRVWLEGPYGALTADLRTRPGVLLVAAGIGISPMRALLEELPGPVTLLYRASDEAGLALRGELELLARSRGHEVRFLVGHRGGPQDVTHPEVLTRLVPDVAQRDVYLCGPEPFMQEVERALRAVGVPAAAVHAEHFALEPVG
jgi:predicted ferric reductase